MLIKKKSPELSQCQISFQTHIYINQKNLAVITISRFAFLQLDNTYNY